MGIIHFPLSIYDQAQCVYAPNENRCKWNQSGNQTNLIQFWFLSIFFSAYKERESVFITKLFLWILSVLDAWHEPVYKFPTFIILEFQSSSALVRSQSNDALYWVLLINCYRLITADNFLPLYDFVNRFFFLVPLLMWAFVTHIACRQRLLWHALGGRARAEYHAFQVNDLIFLLLFLVLCGISWTSQISLTICMVYLVHIVGTCYEQLTKKNPTFLFISSDHWSVHSIVYNWERNTENNTEPSIELVEKDPWQADFLIIHTWKQNNSTTKRIWLAFVEQMSFRSESESVYIARVSEMGAK